MKPLIELDEYLNLDVEPLYEEFVNTIDTIPKKYWHIFLSNADKYNGGDGTGEIYEGSGYRFEPIAGDNDSPDVQTLYLRTTTPEVDLGTDYFTIDKSECWVDLPIYEKFPKIKKMISELPYESVGRIMLIFSKNGTEIVTHYDHDCRHWRQEMIWIGFNDAKKLLVEDKDDTIYLKGNSCWCDSQRRHGTKSDGYSVSIRVDGKWKSDFRNKIFGEGSEWETITKWD